MSLLHVEDPMDWRTRSRHGTVRHACQVRAERVPELIDSLDCLLALWVAEATLDCEPVGALGPSASKAGA